MRILLFLSSLIATTAPLSGQIGYPSTHSNFDERKIGTYQLPDLLTTSIRAAIHDAIRTLLRNIQNAFQTG